MKLSIYENEAANWLCKAQDFTSDGGISKFYVINKGWSEESYKEVSGYIIPTFFDLFAKTKNKIYKERALRIADWEVKVQDRDGKWEYVFDTGQVLLGLTRAYAETKDQKYIDSIVKAANFLVNVQSKNGSWNSFEFALGLGNKILRGLGLLNHAYNTRTAWALLEVWKITKNSDYREAAMKNLDWVLSRQLKNGYYKDCSTYLHYLTYTASGLLEAGLILKDEKYINSARLFADNCLQLIQKNGFLQGNFNKNWLPVKPVHSSLTSDAQLAILLFKFNNLTKNKKYSLGAKKLLNFVKSNQNITTNNLGIRGGIPGSQPINGFYCSNMILSWATKFYLDALLIENLAQKPKTTKKCLKNNPFR
jgi:hypothetical protein